MKISSFELIMTLCLALALLHTFAVKKLQRLGGSFFHLLGEVEVIFGFWAMIGLSVRAATEASFAGSVGYLDALDFREAIFVFVILIVCGTKPILELVSLLIEAVATVLVRVLALPRALIFVFCLLAIGPLLGSFVTEPAAMTVTALLLQRRVFSKSLSSGLKYALLGTLFVNVSVGGVLTSFAAPPVLMVAGKFGWSTFFMLTTFGWKGALTCALTTAALLFRHRGELKKLPFEVARTKRTIPVWVLVLHLLFLCLIVLSAHHTVVFVGLFLFFLGLLSVTREHHENLRLRQGLLVAFFLGGLVALGGPQRWWLEPLFHGLRGHVLYFSAAAFTAIIDNAAITFLGAQVPNLEEASRYFLVAGSVVGGGLTVIANAPNPVGYSLLNGAFGASGISPVRLLRGALLPTVIAAIVFLI